MAYDKQQKIVFDILKESWGDFKVYYRKEESKYSQNNEKGHVVCWKEDDMVLQLSRFFYKRLDESELKDKGIEFHSQTELSKDKFKSEYLFNGKLAYLQNSLGHIPKPDFIITKEDDYTALWLVGEVKYFREWRSAQKSKINKDLDELKALKSLGICKRTAYLLADDNMHPHYNRKGTQWIDLQKRLKEEQIKIAFIDLIIMCRDRKCDKKFFDFN